MGFFGDLWDTVKSVGKTIGKAIFGDDSGGGHSSTSTSTNITKTSQTVYEPDRVKVAQLEKEKMEKAIEAQKELMQMNREMQEMIIKAHTKGFEETSKLLKELLVSLNKIAQERLLLIENGHFEIVKKIEELYMGLEKEINNDTIKFNTEDLPKMLEMHAKFPEDSVQSKLYAKSIDKQIEMSMEFFRSKLKALHERQKMMIESSIISKEQILKEASLIVDGRIKFLEAQLQNQKHLLENKEEIKEIEAKVIKE